MHLHIHVPNPGKKITAMKSLILLTVLLLTAGSSPNLPAVSAPDPYPCVKLVKDINPNGHALNDQLLLDGYLEDGVPNDNSYIGEFQGALYFGATAGPGSGIQLWKTDGTPANTKLFKTIFQGGDSNPTGFTRVGNVLFFVATAPGTGPALWRSDGTQVGTYMVKDLMPGNALINPPTFLRNVNGVLFLAADITDDGISNYVLHKSDGTNAGTVPVRYLDGTQVPVWVDPANNKPVVLNGVYYFIYNRELLRSDGTSWGTYRLKDINPNGLDEAARLTVASTSIFFSANDGVHGSELWKSDGTPSGTLMVKDINPSTTSVGAPAGMYAIGSTVYFLGPNLGLWKSDGTAAGTILLKANPNNYASTHYGALNGMLFFSADDGVHGLELWRSDGTAAGTVMVKNISTVLDGGNSFDRGSQPASFAAKDGKLYFSANDFVHGRELWVTDGTAAGTKLVKEINPDSDANPRWLTVVGNKLLFKADDGTHGRELFAYQMCGSPFPVSLTTAEDSGSEGLRLNVIGNPVRQSIVVEIHGNGDQPVWLYLTDLQGKQLRKRTLTAVQATERQVFDIGAQAEGIYLLRAVAGEESKTIRIIKSQ